MTFTDQEYKDALLAIDPYFLIVKSVLDQRLKDRCIHADTTQAVLDLQAQFKLLSQIETEINNNKVGN